MGSRLQVVGCSVESMVTVLALRELVASRAWAAPAQRRGVGIHRIPTACHVSLGWLKVAAVSDRRGFRANPNCPDA